MECCLGKEQHVRSISDYGPQSMRPIVLCLCCCCWSLFHMILRG